MGDPAGRTAAGLQQGECGLSNGESTDSANEKRRLEDRRRFSWRTVVFGYLRSRRRGHRRGAEPPAVFIDWHHPWLFILATGTMLLSTLDAFFTLHLLEHGATEVNPVMAIAIELGPFAFAASKMLLTGIGLLLVVFAARSRLFNRFRTGLVLTMFFTMYACLVCYQSVLLLRLH